MRLTFLAIAALGMLPGCNGDRAPKISSGSYDADRCGGIVAGWHKVDDYGGMGDPPMRNVIALKHDGVTWNGVSVDGSDLDEIYKALQTHPGPELLFAIEKGTSCQRVLALRSKLDSACHMGSRCFEFSEVELAKVTPPDTKP